MTPDKTPSDALAPCPFCGAGETHIHVNKGTWNGQGYGEPVSVEVRHWCAAVPGQPSRMISRAGRDEASATAAWNTRWGSPVVATKVSIPTHTMEQEFQNHYRRGFDAGKKAGSPVVAVEPKRVFIVATGEEHEGEATYTRYDDAPPPLCDSECLYTTPQPTQAQAGAVPLTREQVKAICVESGYETATLQERADFITGIRHAERHHGIKGGQRGTE